VKILLTNKDEIKPFSEKEKLRESGARKPAYITRKFIRLKGNYSTGKLGPEGMN